LVKQRLCCSGMRWTPEGTQIILSLRALVLTETSGNSSGKRSTSMEVLNYWPHPLRCRPNAQTKTIKPIVPVEDLALLASGNASIVRLVKRINGMGSLLHAPH
jgi:hypothetical protein